MSGKRVLCSFLCSVDFLYLFFVSLGKIEITAHLDGIFIGAMRSNDMRNGMLLSLAIFLGSVNFLIENYGYNGLWAALYIFMFSRGITLMIKYPQISKSLKVVPVSNTD